MYIKVEFNNEVLGLVRKRLSLTKSMLIKKGCFSIVR
jgi:hypothetical protein